MSTKGKLFLIMGPSGVGKGTAINIIKEKHPEFVFPTSVTTRDIRPGEKPGDVYHFISKEEFKAKIEAGELLEYAIVHNNNYYGTLKSAIIKPLNEGKTVIREVDMQGVISIRDLIPADQLVVIFITAPDYETLVRRIKGRSELPQDEIQRRMESAKKEFDYADECDYVIPSLDHQIPKLVDDVVAVIEKETQSWFRPAASQ